MPRTDGVPRLMLVSDRRLAERDRLAAAATAASRAGPILLQLREKDLPAADLLAMARDLLADLPPPPRVRLVVNGRFDVALAAGADGVHLPAAGPPLARLREAVGDRFRVGVSTHSADEVAEAAAAGADYALFGPVFDTPSKRTMGAPQGTAALAEAVEAGNGMPVFAVGGIDPGRAGLCREAGAHGVAVIRAILEAEDFGGAATELLADAAEAGERSR